MMRQVALYIKIKFIKSQEKTVTLDTSNTAIFYDFMLLFYKKTIKGKIYSSVKLN